MNRFEVLVRRDGRFWYLDIPEVGATQARSLTEVEGMARDYVAGMLELDPGLFELDVRIELSDDVRRHLEAAASARHDEALARRRAAEESRAAAKSLRQSGLTEREIGIALGVSHQRAHQLVSS